MTVAEAHAAGSGTSVAAGAVPREYNFAADVLQSNLAAGRANKAAYIDARGTLTYGQLADRVARFAGPCADWASSAKSACCSRCSTRSIGRLRFWVA